MKNIAGKEAKKLSFTLILVIKPRNINKHRPPDDNSRIGFENNPTNNPQAPSICNEIINRLRCFRLNLWNSLAKWGEKKYEIE